MSQESKPKRYPFQRSTYVREVADRLRCTTCGYRIRGPNHEQGQHHKAKRKESR